jgi:methyl-accepting chemotaxis protein
VTQDSGNSVSALMQQLNEVVSQSGTIMEGLRSATEPLPETINSLMQENEARQKEYLSLLGEIRGFNEKTSAQASQLMETWDDHKARFEQIDAGLSGAFSALTDQVEKNVLAASQVSKKMGDTFNQAVEELAGLIEDLTEAAEKQRGADPETRDTN